MKRSDANRPFQLRRENGWPSMVDNAYNIDDGNSLHVCRLVSRLISPGRKMTSVVKAAIRATQLAKGRVLLS